MTSVCVGNDVVDLERPRTVGRADDERFVARVLDPEEQETVRASDEQDLEVWCHWAAKEAGYKAISKLVGDPPPFVHRAFRVAWSDAAESPDAGTVYDLEASRPSAGSVPGTGSMPVIRRGSVTWRGRRARVSVALLPGGIHAVASAAREVASATHDLCEGAVDVRPRVELLGAPATPWAGSLAELIPLFSEREADAIYSLASAAVRVGARGHLAELMGVTEHRVEIVCGPGPSGRRPPRVLLDGRPTEADVSLSHDGRLIAWATWVGPNQELS